MFDDREVDAVGVDNNTGPGGNVAAMMQVTAINDDDDDMDEGEETSQYGLEGEN